MCVVNRCASLDTANGTRSTPPTVISPSYNAAPTSHRPVQCTMTVDAVDDTVFEGNEGYA